MAEYEYDEFRPISPSAAFFILIGFFGAGVVIGGLVGLGVWFGHDRPERLSARLRKIC